ncbi:SDR family NAD(P)-dependent oxidoreductase [Streptomyces sp. NPDC058417]|uniref:SDR family NAD(P)-dependent oxidoreductase n=1 Tax=unclassified Streptomyces TaxID=2593676 RepID=UPI0036673584
MRKSVLVTGGTSGIGHATTVAFAARGYDVFATYRKEADREKLSVLDGVRPVRMDVTDRGDLDEAYDLVAGEVGEAGLYAVVNNAGIGHSAPFEYVDETTARRVLEVNLLAPYRVTQKFVPLLAARRATGGPHARVVNVASWAGLVSAPYISFYNASKFGVVGLTESMFYDLRLLGIHAVLAVPGVTKTPLLGKTTADGTASLDALPAEGRERYRELFAHYAALGAGSQNSRFLATPEKVARKLVRIVDTPKPRFKYDIGLDATLVDKVVSRLPWSVRATLNTRMYRLGRASAAHA